MVYYLLGTSAICMSTVCEFPNTLAITSWLVIKAIKVVHTARVVQCSTVANTGKLKLKSNLASVRHGEIYGNLIGSHVYWWQWPWHYLVACFHIPNKHDQTIIFTTYSKQAQLEIVQTKRQYLKQILQLMLSKQKSPDNLWIDGSAYFISALSFMK